MSAETRSFHLSDILSITHDRLFSTRHMDGVYDICNFLTQDKLFTHQLPRVHDECKAHLLALHPQLIRIPLLSEGDVKAQKELNGVNWFRLWVDARVAEYGEYLDVTPLPKGIHQYKEPISEAIEMLRPEKVIVIKTESPE